MRKIVLVSLILLVTFASAAAEGQSFWIKGYKYYPLYSICQKKGIDYEWDSVGRVATLSKYGIEAKIRAGSDKILINGEQLKDIGPPLYFYKGTVVVPRSFATKGIGEIFKYKSKSYAKKNKRSTRSFYTIKRIVLDPGHGGKDPGAIGRYYKLKEKDVVLDVAKRLKRLLSAYGIKVYLTRSKDSFVPLRKRTEFANKKKADFFISIHANASRAKRAKGFEVYYLSEATDDNSKALEAAENASLKFEKSSIDRYNLTTRAIASDLSFTENRIQSRELAKHLIRAVKGKIYVKDRGDKGARFHVLKNTNMSAVLVEIGFISNKKEEGQFRSSSHKAKIAEGLARGILAYKDKYEKTNGFTR